MKTIELKFPDGPTLTYQAPSQWTDLTPGQYIRAIATMLHANQTEPAAQWALLPLLIGIKPAQVDALNEVQRVELLMSMDFLFDLDHLPYQCMVPSFSTLEYRRPGVNRKLSRLLGTTLHGPGDGLQHLTFGEFMYAEQLNLASQTPQGPDTPQYINQLLGTLYRRADRHRRGYDDPRVPFQSGRLASYGKDFELVDSKVKNALLLNYQGAKAFLPTMYTHVFPPELQDTDPDAPRPKPNPAAWLNAGLQLVKLDPIGFENIQKVPLHTALKSLDETLKQDEATRAEYERMRRNG